MYELDGKGRRETYCVILAWRGILLRVLTVPFPARRHFSWSFSFLYVPHNGPQPFLLYSLLTAYPELLIYVMLSLCLTKYALRHEDAWRIGCTHFFCKPILFAICTSTFSKLCKNMYTVACRRVLSSASLWLIGSKPLVAFGNKIQTKP
jgi:hypothetical protein